MHPNQPVQNMALVSHLDGPIDADRFVGAFRTVVAHYEVLRTTLPNGDDTVALAPVNRLPTTDIVPLAREDVEKWATQRSATPLDLRRCGYDSVLLLHDDGTSSWYLCLHHVLTDATSSSLVFEATGQVYSGKPLAPARSYYDWSADTERARQQADPTSADTGFRDTSTRPTPAVIRAREYWAARKPAPRIGRLYRDLDRTTARASRISLDPGDELLVKTRARLNDDLRMLTEHLGWTTLLTTATALYLHRVSGADEFAVGLPVHNRTSPEQRGIVGPLMEVFPVDVSIEPGDTGRSVHKRIGRSIMATLRHAVAGTAPAADFESVVNVIPQVRQERFGNFPATTRWIHPGAIDGSHILRLQMTSYACPTTAAMPLLPKSTSANGQVGSGLTGDGQLSNGQAASGEMVDGETADQSPLSMNTLEMPTVDLQRDHDSRWEFALDLADDACGVDQTPWVPGHLLATLDAIVTDPDQPLSAWNLIDQSERDVIQRWGTGVEARREPQSGPVAELRAALVTNRSVVLEHDDRKITGPELWRWVEATGLWMQQRGVVPGDRVGIDLTRSAEAVVAILATLAVGGSFVPLDPSQPRQRRQRLATRAGCRLIVGEPATIAAYRPAASEQRAPFTLGPDDADAEAYVIFTSGSTGEPKGVPISRAGLVRYLDFALDRYTGGRRPGLVAPLFSPLTFDLTITTLFVPFLARGRLLVVGSDGPRGLAEVARRTDITWCKATPSHLEILVRLLPADHRLTTIIVGGEAFPSRLANDLLAGNREREIHNEYGPTEAVVGCMDYRVEPRIAATQAEIPIGGPAPGVALAIVDRYLQPVPLGSPGELLISSPGVTAGYLADGSTDNEQLNDAFIERNGRRWYRSGDLVRLQDPQRLVYLGRRDEQVKVGGIRLEPTEVEAALAEHPTIDQAVVRVWSPSANNPDRHCVRCGLPDNIPGVAFDELGVCETCHAYDRVAPVTESWFRTPDQLVGVRDRARSRRTGSYDCLHLLSGGKDSTYALYQLVENGFRPYSLTLDNGFISDQAKANVARSVADLGIDHEFVTVEAMNEIFRDSLERHSNVCHGCYKTIYTVAVTKATELGIPLIVTGLSRGQLFETRLIPQQFAADRFDPDAIDRAVAEARRVYHRADDAANRLLDTTVFDDEATFDRIEYLDFYRYVNVELSEMLRFLDQRAPWVRPNDTGRSTNCLINAVGIHTHQSEQGFHNYAVPYAWDVRLGHKTRDEAIEELDDRLDLVEVNAMLDAVGYTPRPRRFLTAWLLAVDGQATPSPSELRTFLSESLPSYAIPSAFVTVDDLPLSTNGKLDTAALPAPSRVHRSSATVTVPAATGTEAAIIELWERTLGVEPIGIDDDFFALGGDSLSALQMTVALSACVGYRLSDDLAFVHTTPRALGEAVDHLTKASGSQPVDASNRASTDPTVFSTEPGVEPERSDGELAVLFDQAQRPDDVMYNVARVYRVAGLFDGAAFEQALRDVAARHQPLSWTYASPRVQLDSDSAIICDVRREPVDDKTFVEQARELHLRPFDIKRGPLLRAVVQPLTNGFTAVMLIIHHASGDAASFDRLWEQIDQRMSGADLPDLAVDYAGFGAWQRDRRRGPEGEAAKAHWLAQADTDRTLARLAVHPPSSGDDGFVTRHAAVSPERLRAVTRNSTAAAVIGLLAGVLGRYHDGDDLELGLITSTRDHRAAERLVGYFLNTVPVRFPAGPARNEAGSREPLRAIDLADRAAEAIGGALPYRSYPLAQLIADRRAAGLGDIGPDVLVSYDELPTLSFQGAPVDQQVLWNGSAVAPLTFFAEARPERIDLSVEYQGDRIPAELAEQVLQAWEHALLTAAREPEATVDHLVDESLKKHGTLSIQTRPSPPTTSSVVEQLVDWFERPDAGTAVAVECGDRTLTWAELQQRSSELAAALLDRGIAVGDRVAVLLGRETELVVAMAAIGRIGASYVPIDPTHPRERHVQAMSSAQASVLVAVPDTHLAVEEGALLAIDGDTIDGRPWGSDPAAANRLDRLDQADDELALGREAYLIFTSGSTGKPRGVPVSIGHLTTSTAARSSVYPGSPERFLMPSSPAFDSSIVGLYWTLAKGGTVVLPTERTVRDVDALLKLLASVDHALMVPTLYRALLDRSRTHPTTSGPSSWPAQIIVAGEACPASLVADHTAAYPASVLTNEYGPTEATVWATAHHCRPGDDPVPLGPPIPGTTVAIVDRHDRVRPVGVNGSLVVAGDGVVEGYLDNADASARAFASLDLPGIGTSGIFRTGDQAVYTPAPGRGRPDRLLFLGRVDNRLNIGGVRVEPEEIEGVLAAVDAVSAVVVTTVDIRSRDQLLQELSPSSVSGALRRAAADPDPAEALDRELRTEGHPDIRLVAHVEPADAAKSGGVDEGALRAAASASLPPSLRPGRYVIHQRLPRTPNGKIDRAAAGRLPLPSAGELRTGTGDNHSAPSTAKADSRESAPLTAEDGPGDQDRPDLVPALQRIFTNTLRSGPLRPNDSFFDHGGHSLLAMELVLAVEDETGAQFGPGLLYDHPTPRGLAEALISAGLVTYPSVTTEPAASKQAHDGLKTGPGASGAALDRSLLVPIQTGGSRPPMFAIHVLGVDCAFFRPLADELGHDQPIYGLGQPRVDADLDTSNATAVRDVALGYAAEIARVAPDGPISLAAISLGAVVAWELALELQRRGRQVDLLALFDALGPDNILFNLDGQRRLAAHWSRARTDPARYAKEQANHQGQRARRAAERAGLAAQRRLGLRPSHRLEIRRFIEDNIRSQIGYTFEPYDGRVLVVKAADDPFTEEHLATSLGWRQVVSGQLDITVAPGEHLSMMEAHNVPAVAAAINRCLDSAAHSETTATPATVDQQVSTEPGQQLIDALHRGELAMTVARLLKRTDLYPHQAQLVTRVDRLMRDLAQSSQMVSDRVAAALQQAGVDAEPGRLPSRLSHPMALIDITTNTDPEGVLRAVDTMRALDYRPVTTSEDGDETARALSADRLEFVGERDGTGRVQLRWRGSAREPVTGRGDGDQNLGIFIRTPVGLVPPLLAVGGLTTGQLLIDLGCGDGGVLIEAAQRLGVRAVGYESDPDLVAAGRARVADAGLTQQVSIVESDARTADVSKADLVFAFLPPEAVNELLVPTLDRMKPGSRFLSHEQLATVTSVEPHRSELVVSDPAAGPETAGLTVAKVWEVGPA